jgi:hypothetical protein
MAEEEITHAHAGGRVKENAPTEKLTGEGEAWQRVTVGVANAKIRVRKRAVGRIRAVNGEKRLVKEAVPSKRASRKGGSLQRGNTKLLPQ